MTNKEAIEILRDTPIDIRSNREGDIYTLYTTAQNMAIEELERKEPKKVKFNKDETYGSPYYCPSCGAMMEKRPPMTE